MPSEFEKERVFRDRKTEHKTYEQKYKHARAEPYVRRPLNKRELLEAWEETEEVDE